MSYPDDFGAEFPKRVIELLDGVWAQAELLADGREWTLLLSAACALVPPFWNRMAAPAEETITVDEMTEAFDGALSAPLKSTWSAARTGIRDSWPSSPPVDLHLREWHRSETAKRPLDDEQAWDEVFRHDATITAVLEPTRFRHPIEDLRHALAHGSFCWLPAARDPGLVAAVAFATGSSPGRLRIWRIPRDQFRMLLTCWAWLLHHHRKSVVAAGRRLETLSATP